MQQQREWKKGEIVGYVERRVEARTTVEPKRWYVLKTLPNMEVTAAAGLIARDWRAYNPEIFKRDLRGGKVIERRVPMFPSYIFIKLTEGEDDFGAMRKIRGVVDFLAFADEEGEEHPAVLPEFVMPRIWAKEAMQKAYYYEETGPKPYKAGDVVRLPESAVPDQMALIEDLDDAGRVTVLMNFLGSVRRVRTRLSKLAPV